ncbi:MAG: alpha/beta hydrolase [Pseudomonadota bacterium]
MANSVVLIHGAFAGPWTMETFAGKFRDRGWDCHTPALRFHDGDPKADPDPAFAETSILDYTEDLAEFVETLESPPIIGGHAVGGLIAQKLAARGLARGLLLLNSNVPWGLLPATDDQRAVAKGLMSAGAFWQQPMRVEFDLIADYALNKLTPEAQRVVFERLGPESGRVVFEMFFWMFDDARATEVDFDRVDCPVLVVTGAEDRAVPSVSARQIADCYGSRASLREVPGRAHFITLEPGWERVAEDCAEWMAEVFGT